MTNEQAIKLDSEYMVQSYGRHPVAISHGSGASMYSLDGKKYIDFTSGIGVNCLGYADPDWVSAVSAQLREVVHMSNYFVSPKTAILAQRLVELSSMKRVFMSNSGAEANEGAIKTARKYSRDKYGEGRSTIITLINSFHGRTVTTLAATGQDSFHKDFGPFTEGFKYSPLNNIEALKAAATSDVCAVMAEVVQGEGGVFPVTAEFVSALRRLCADRDILLIFDEVQCGIGRTGRMFAWQHFDSVKPDIMTLAKGLGGGLPIGAFIVGEKCEFTIGKGQHGSTFGGNPVVAAGSNAVLDKVSSPGFLDEVAEKGRYIADAIKSMNIPYLKEVRGLGMMIGAELVSPSEGGAAAGAFAGLALQKGLLLLTAGSNTVRLLPPLTISMAKIEEGLAIFKETANKINADAERII